MSVKSEGKKIMDRRTIDRNIEKKLVTSEEYNQYLQSLPDDAENAEWVNMEVLEMDFSEADLNEEVFRAQAEAKQANLLASKRMQEKLELDSELEDGLVNGESELEDKDEMKE